MGNSDHKMGRSGIILLHFHAIYFAEKKNIPFVIYTGADKRSMKRVSSAG